ncbi:MAG TPA: hypothetical protein VFH06_00055 [Candidatus Saccharimonadales bacterium]|nr:hypothetical protein [Candidatus Saccharimonadales bacterium]
MRTALNAKRGYDADMNIDSTEVEAVDAALSRIEEMLLEVADTNSTKDTVAIVQVVELMLPSILTNIDGPTARKLLAAYNNGEEIKAGTDPELARKAKLYDEVTDEDNEDSLAAQLKKLQDTANNGGTRQLGSGSTTPDPAVEAVIDRIRPLVTNATAARVDGLIDLITTTNGLSPQVAGERSELALLIMEGGNHPRLGNWAIVDDPNGSHRKPQILVDALAKVKTLTTERDDAKSALTSERDDKKDGSLAKKLKDAEAAKVTAETAKTAAETALTNERDENKSGSLAQQLKAAKVTTAPTNMVDKATVKAEVAKVAAELREVRNGFPRPKNLQETMVALRKVNDLVK